MAVNYIICQKCKTENINVDYCVGCGEMINIFLKRQKEEYKRKIEQKRVEKKTSNFSLTLQKLRNHPNTFVRLIVGFFYSVGIITIVFAAVVAAVIASLAG